MHIKAITLHQPWASLLAYAPEVKQCETRSWEVNCPSPIAIHAAKREINLEELTQLEQNIFEIDPDLLKRLQETVLNPEKLNQERGMVLAIASNAHSQQIDYDLQNEVGPLELATGDWDQGRWAITFPNLVTIEPFEAKGKQRVWSLEVPQSLEVLVDKLEESSGVPDFDPDEDWDDQPWSRSDDDDSEENTGFIVNGREFNCHSVRISPNKKTIKVGYSYLDTKANTQEVIRGHLLRYDHIKPHFERQISQIIPMVIRATGTTDCWTEEMLQIQAFTFGSDQTHSLQLKVGLKTEGLSNWTSFPMTLRRTEGMKEGYAGEFTGDEYQQVLKLKQFADAFCGGDRVNLQLELDVDIQVDKAQGELDFEADAGGN